MAFAHVQGNSSADGAAASTTCSVTLGAAVTSGNGVTGYVAYITAAADLTSVTDDKGNTYTIVDTVQDTTAARFWASFHLGNISNGPVTITANLSTSLANVRITVDEFSGGGAWTVEGHAMQANTAITNPTSGNTAALTAGDLLYSGAMLGQAFAVTFTQPSGYTMANNPGGTTTPIATSYNLAGGSGAQAAQWTLSAGRRCVVGLLGITAGTSGTTVNLTGAAVASAAGLLLPTVAFSLSGAAAASAAATPATAITGTLAGAAVATAAGVLAPAISVSLSGTAVTTAAGTPAPTVTWTPAGVAVATAAGVPAVTVGQVVSLTGAAITSAAGILAPTITKTLPGAAVAGAAGVPAPTILGTLSGATATTAAGVPAPTVAVTLAGAGTTTAAGVPAKTINPVLSGAAAASAAGTIAAGAGVVVVVPGAAVTGTAGSLAPTIARTLAGASANSAAGAIAAAPGVAVSMAGAAAASAAGTLGPTVATVVAGAAVASAAGTITVSTPSGAVVIPMPGTSVSSAAGVPALSQAITAVLSGVQAATAAGPILVTAFQPVVPVMPNGRWRSVITGVEATAPAGQTSLLEPRVGEVGFTLFYDTNEALSQQARGFTLVFTKPSGRELRIDYPRFYIGVDPVAGALSRQRAFVGYVFGPGDLDEAGISSVALVKGASRIGGIAQFRVTST